MDMKTPEMAMQFLHDIGWGDSIITPLAGDASFRRYFRVNNKSERQAVLMDAPPPHEDPKPFIDIAEYLSKHGFRAPEIYGRDISNGLVLIEDFGDQRMREHLDDTPQDEEDIYKQAIDIIIKLSKVDAASVAPYDEDVYLREANLLPQWYMPAVNLNADQQEYEAIWSDILKPLYDSKKVTVLRDYHAENIMLLSDGTMGIIDFQDALAGHQAYDLVSLLQDARRDVSPELEEKMLAYYCDNNDVYNDFRLDYAILGAQRNSKIIGIFARLCFRDGKHKYLDYLPRMWGLLDRDLQHPKLIKLKQWFDNNIPSSIRYGKIEINP